MVIILVSSDNSMKTCAFIMRVFRYLSSVFLKILFAGNNLMDNSTVLWPFAYSLS